jgi:predicted secreted protein
MSAVASWKGKLGFSSVLTPHPLTYTEVGVTQSITATLTSTAAEITTKGSAGWQEFLKTLKTIELNGTMLYDRANTALDSLRDAFLADTPLDFALLDGGFASLSEGPRFVGQVTEFSIAQDLDGVLQVTFKAQVTEKGTGIAPSWLVIA